MRGCKLSAGAVTQPGTSRRSQSGVHLAPASDRRPYLTGRPPLLQLVTRIHSTWGCWASRMKLAARRHLALAQTTIEFQPPSSLRT